MFTGECSRGQCGLTGRSFCIQSDSDAGGGGERVTVDRDHNSEGKDDDGLPRKHCFLQVVGVWLFSLSVCCIAAFQEEAKHFPFWVLRSVQKQCSICMLKITATNVILAISHKWCNCVSKPANVSGHQLTQFLLPLKQVNSCPSCFAQVQGGLTRSQLEGAETHFLSHRRVLRRGPGFVFVAFLFLSLLAFIFFWNSFFRLVETQVETRGQEKI